MARSSLVWMNAIQHHQCMETDDQNWKKILYYTPLYYDITLSIKLNTLPYYPHSPGPLQWGHSNCALKRSVAARLDVLRWKEKNLHINHYDTTTAR